MATVKQSGDPVTTGVEKGLDDPKSDVHDLLEQAEAEIAEAEAAAAAARARVKALRGDGDSADEAPPAPSGPWYRRPTAIAKVVAAVVIVASLAGSGYIAWEHHTASAERERRAQFATTAADAITALTSLDFNNAEADVRRIIEGSTGPFLEDFQSRAPDFVAAVQQSKVVSKGTVTVKAVASMTDDSAEVLVAATAEITNAAGNKQPRYFRFRVTVVEDGDQLKVSKVELVP